MSKGVIEQVVRFLKDPNHADWLTRLVSASADEFLNGNSQIGQIGFAERILKEGIADKAVEIGSLDISGLEERLSELEEKSGDIAGLEDRLSKLEEAMRSLVEGLSKKPAPVDKAGKLKRPKPPVT